MIVLDTNVITVLASAEPHEDDQVVLDWVTNHSAGEIWVTTISRAELAYGVALLPAGRRQLRLSAAVDRFFDLMEPFTIPFDSGAAQAYGGIAARRRKAGNPISSMDAQIAACAMTARAKVATRDLTGFSSVGIGLVNPWDRRTW
ncbi:MAG: type II toxin-antitoxin system VapC family toxin [Bifidobacteriaceae bacterium]|jgi:predicted nucleic acid-binding protein|nr:type II toxin-antitoxin system VapC family toxin [Bifidobacteriaceae bacterium]